MAKRKKRRKAGTVSACGSPMDGVLAKALGHPLRAEILAFLNEHRVASPAEMDRAGVGQNRKPDPENSKLSSISYHIRVLLDLGLVKQVRSRPVRGSVEHFYEANARMLLDIEEWSRLPKATKNDVSITALEETLGLASNAVAADTFDSFDERAVINLTLRLDEEGFIRLADDLTELMNLAEQRQSEALQRVDGNLDALVYASTSLLLYQSPPPERPGQAEGPR
ncbi:MAG TPA: helix-turn-helix domain-containing protein [Solirubrobacterales bacterium]|nr:helix-turn-helix domain-containing protein [Solirubrobacterales bacterium]